ncbi:MAG: hypothetical protein RL213_602 [Bacteroidota bacterium]|jgi:membrane associated rhomboid family serine protease
MFDTIRYHVRTADTLYRLILLNVSVFAVIRLVNVVSLLFMHPWCDLQTISQWWSVPADLGRLLFRPWTPLSYMFLHWDFMHLLMNMIWLYWFGQIFMEFLGARKLLATYLLGGFAGAFLYCLSYNTLPLFSDSMPYSTAMGASASIMAITIATATLLPDYRISLLFIGEVRLKWVAVVILFLDLINISSSNAGGHISHLGGALYGFVFIRMLQRGTDISAWLQRITYSASGTAGRLRVVSRAAKSSDESYLSDQKSREQELDRILDKIGRSGYGSLTAAEREFLTRAGNEK